MSSLPPDPFSTPSHPPPGFVPVEPTSGVGGTGQPVDPGLPQPSPGPPLKPVRWGMGDAALGLVLAQVFAIVGGVVILGATGKLDTAAEGGVELSLTITALLQIPLWAGYLGVPIYAATRKGNGVAADFGLRMRWFDPFLGIGVGIGLQILVGLLYWGPLRFIDPDDVSESARELTDKADDPLGVVLLILIVAIGAPIVEELFFRGLLLRSVERRWGTVAGVLISSLVFGAVHFQLPGLPALTLVGLGLALVTVRTGRLGPAIWAHLVFNSLTVANLLSTS